MNENLHRVVGIDLGTTYSAVAAYNRYTEEAEIIKNPEDKVKPETTPSVVSLDPRSWKVIVGRAAKNNLVHDPANTIIEIKREMGEVFREEMLDKFQARGLFRPVSEGFEGDPVKVRFNGQWFMPQEISAFTLMKMKENAEREIGEEIRDAVVTVPAYFTEKQRKATEEAALLAGLYPRQLIPEPTAAAICYGVDRMEETRKVYLVYDLGGGTFDVSIITVEERNIEAIATSGDPRLGGGDFDDAITQWAVEQLLNDYEIDVRDNPAAKAFIKLRAEKTKIDLSTFDRASLPLVELNPRNPPTLELTRTQFEEMIQLLLNKALTYVDTAIKIAEAQKGVYRDDIDAILLVGGSSRIPKIKEQLLNYFQKEESFLRADMDPDAVVARGAAIIAIRFSPSPAPFDITKQVDKTLVSTDEEDVVNVRLIAEHSLGVGVQDNLMSRIVDQGTNIPVSEKRGGYTNPDRVEYIEARVYQGEGKFVFDNTLIGVLKIGPMEPKPEGYHQFEVTFSLDRDGLLSMMVHHLNENRTYQATFEQRTGIGGPKALAAVRNKLLQMYGFGIAPEIPATAPAQFGAGAPAVQVPPPPVPVPSTPDAQPEIEAEAPEETAETDKAGSPEQAAEKEEDLVVEPTVEVPAQFKTIVRRAWKLLLKQVDAELLEAFNAFTIALNTGAAEKDLEDPGDELEDVYHDTRSRLSRGT